MAFHFNDTLKNLQQTVNNLQADHDKIKKKAEKSQCNSGFSEEISMLEGIEKRLEKVEEIGARNRFKMQAVLEMVGTLSQKVDNVSTIVSESTDKFRTRQDIPTQKVHKSSEKEPVIMLTKKEHRLQKSYHEPVHQTRTAKIENNDVHQETMNHKQGLQYSIADKCDISIQGRENRPVTLSEVTLVTTKSEICDKTPNPGKPKPKLKIIQRSGNKVCITAETEDNRVCFRRNTECYQGTLLSPVIKSSDQPNQPAPNILRKQTGLFEDDSTPHPQKASGMMTMAQMTERDYESKQNVHSFSEWAFIANQSQIEVALEMFINRGKKGRGHYYVLLLDTSGSMRGEKFDLMIKTTLEYIEGLQRIASQFEVVDNVGLACFGEETKLILAPTPDYENIKTEIRSSTIEEHSFKPFIILMTDGMPTNVEAPTEKDNVIPFSAPMLQDMLIDHELKTAFSSLCPRVQVFCVPFGSTYTEVLNTIVKKTHGKIIPHTQIGRLSRMTLTLVETARVAKDLECATDVNRALVKEAVVSAGLQNNDLHDDITEGVLTILDPSSQGRFRQTRWSSLPLGSRVRRGAHWHWKNQDSNMAGTVIGEDAGGETVWVKWDSGHTNCYTYSENPQDSDLKTVNEPRILVDDLIAVGCKVKRGKAWKYGEQDGGKGGRGTVLRVEAHGKVVVYWERGRLGTYRFADNEIEVCGSGQTLSSSDLIDDEKSDGESKSTVDMPLILPTHNAKDVTSVWQYQDETGEWVPYDDDTNFKVEKAYIRNPNGKCIIEIDKTIYRVIFSKMIQENNKDKSQQPIRRLEKSKEEVPQLSI